MGKLSLNKKAYKIYLWENATPDNLYKPDLYDTQDEFELTQSKIALLIKHVLKEGSLKLNRIRTTGAAKTFAKLGDRDKDYEQDLHDEFAKIFGLKGYSDFFADKDLLKKYTDKAKQPTEQQGQITYIFYYWNGDDVGRASLRVSVNGKKEWTKAQITYYVFDAKRRRWFGSHSEETDSKLQDDIIVEGKNMRVLIRRDTPTYLQVYNGNGKFNDNRKYRFCVYATSFEGCTFGGVGILMQSSGADISEKINQPVEPGVYNVLFQRRSFLRTSEESHSFINTEYFNYISDFTKASKKFAGVYKGYYLDSEFKDKGAFRSLLLEISPSGAVQVHDGESDDLHGFCSIAAGHRVLYITCDFKFEVGGIPRYQITMEMPVGKHDELEGVYSGYSKNNKPYMGLIKLYKLPNTSSIEEAKTKIAIQYFTTDEQASGNFEQSIPTDILNYFIRQRFYNSPDSSLHKDYNFTKFNNEAYNGPTGVFVVYSSSSLRKGVVRYPLLIRKDGTAVLKTKDGTQKGIANLYFKDDYLVIDFHTGQLVTENKPSKGIYLFTFRKKEKFAILPGVSLRLNEDYQPQAKREFLIRLGEADKKSTEAASKKQFDSLLFETIMPADFKKHSVGELDLKTLLGREYNLIVVSTDLEKMNKVTQRESFDRLYFHQALFLYLKARRDNNSEVKKYLKLSIEHGLNQKRLFQKYLDEYISVYRITLVNRFSHLERLYEQALSQYEKLSVY